MIPKISEAEWRVMRLFWQKSPRTANDIVDKLEGITNWNRQTIRTMINRLVQKGALSFEKDGREYQYYPLVKEAECQKMEFKSFIKRVYNGALQPIIVTFLEETNISDEEIENLEKLLEEKRRKK